MRSEPTSPVNTCRLSHVAIDPRDHAANRRRARVEKVGEDQERSDDAVPVPNQAARPQRLVGAVLDPRFEVGQIELFAEIPKRVREHRQQKHDEEGGSSSPATLRPFSFLPAHSPLRTSGPHPACILNCERL